MPSDDNGYLARNQRSRAHATHDKEPWTADEDAYILAEWPNRTVEEDVAMHLGRTIAACRQRFSMLTTKSHDTRPPRSVEVCIEVCTGCWTVLPKTGICDNCEEN